MNANNNTDYLNAINSAADSWNTIVPSKYTLSYTGTSTSTAFEEDGISLICFAPKENFTPQESMASTINYRDNDGHIIETDMIINSGYNWSPNTSTPTSYKNLQSTMLHEFGHWLNLRDLYGNLEDPYPKDISPIPKVMYFEKKESLGNLDLVTLSNPDIAGLSWIYNHPAPTIETVTPASGDNSRPISVDITGTDYMNTTDRDLVVTLSKTNQPNITATSVNLISSSHISCILPITGADTGIWSITVQNHDGQTGALSDGFTILAPQLSVTSISPSTGVNTGSVTITNLSGTLFQSGATINLTRTGQPNITATNVQVVSSSQSSMYPVPDVLLVQSSTALPADHTGNKPGVQGNPVSLEEEMEYS